MFFVKNLYQQLRFSSFYPLYLRLFRPSIYGHYLNEVRFYKSIIRGQGLIAFDVGANVGDKVAIFTRYFDTVVAIEPDRTNQLLLRNRFSTNHRVIVHHAAVGNAIEKKMFYVNLPGSPANTLSEKWKTILQDDKVNRWAKKLEFQDSYEVDVVTLDLLIASYGKPGYIKIDVEGYELNVLKGLSEPVSIVSFEANFPDFKEETLDCVRQIHSLSHSATFNAINQNFKFFWPTHQSYHSMMRWLQQTDLKYFEVFCFDNP